MDVAKLLEPHGEEPPSGENLEYDPAYVEMELAAQPGEERQEGDKIIEAEDPDYREVAKLAEAVLTRSHDLRAAIFYADAALNTKGLAGFAEATAYVRGCLETHWDTCHPELDEDDDNDPTMRINAVQGLNGDTTIIRSMRRAPLTNSRAFGAMNLRSFDIAEGAIPAPEGMAEIPSSSSIGAAFQDTDSEELQGFLTAANSALEDINAIDQVFVDKTPGQGPDLEEVKKNLNTIIKHISSATGVETTEGEAEAGEDGAPAAAGGAPAVGGSAAINSPQDVSNALDRIIAYYHRAEPSSPVPILLERAKKLVNADFMTIIEDMAPMGVDAVNLIGGIKNESRY